MWIYSLGICLRLTILSKHIQFGGDTVGDLPDDAQQHYPYHHHQQQQQRQSRQQQQQHLYQISEGGRKSGGGSEASSGDVNGTSSLDQIILAMCDPRLTQRASLMFLLDVSFFFLFFFIILRKVQFFLKWRN